MKQIAVFASLLIATACAQKHKPNNAADSLANNSLAVVENPDSLPAPFATKSVTKRSKEIGWPTGVAPKAPAGFVVQRFVENMNSPRWVYQAENGDFFVSLAKTNGVSANEVWLLKDKDGDGVSDEKMLFKGGLQKPFGMLALNGYFYIANTNGLWRWPYQAGQTSLQGEGQKILDLPAGGYNNHWTRNLLASPDGKKIYVSVGSGSNVAEHGIDNEIRRANILEINPDGSGEKVYASGLRNPVGMDWRPGTNVLYTAVNERDELGDELVPDYMTSVKRGGFYGWPYSYYGQIEDPRRKGERPDLVKSALKPDLPLGSHTASLGLAFYDAKIFPAKYQGGAFISQRGSWNRSTFSGYKVVYVPFSGGKPQPSQDFLTGFIVDEAKSEVYGRPVGTLVTQNGMLLVTDDTGGIIWSVKAK